MRLDENNEVLASRQESFPARLLVRLDRYQRDHRWLGLPVALIYKYQEDQGGYLAALITYYGFLSLFPLLLILVTVLGFVLAGSPGLQQQLLHTALGEFPVVGTQLADNVHILHGSVPALVIGILVSLYGALRVAHAAQYALNQVWAIPRRAWPNPVHAYGRALLLVGGLGIALLVTTGLSALTTTEQAFSGFFGVAFGVLIRLVATLLAVATNTGVFVLAFRVLTARQIPLRDLRGGAIVAGVVWQALQELGTYYVARELRGINAAYGLFSIVLGLLAWIYVGAFIVVFAAEFNVVLANRLWPRALAGAVGETTELTRADRRVYAAYAAAQQYTSAQTVQVNFKTPESVSHTESELERTSPDLPRIE
jgi:YihY family inner membrane protein